MEIKVDQFSATSPNPVLRIDKDGTVLYSNKAGETLLNVWGAAVGEKLPSSIGDLVQRVISRNSPEKIEVKVGKSVYLAVFHPLCEEKCVCISGFDVSDQKEFGDKLLESETVEMEKLDFADIVDAHAVQSLMDDFYKLTYIPMSLDDLKGKVLVGVGWQDICTKFHRVHPEACKHCIESSTRLSTGIPAGEFRLFRCKNNMWHIATPVMMRDKHVGDIISGQFFFDDEPLDYELFRFQAGKYGFNEEEYIAALEKVPRLSREAVDTGMSFFVKFASLISQISYSNIKLAQSLSEHDALVDALRESEEKYRGIVETANEGISLISSEGIITYVNKKMADMLGYTIYRIIGRPTWEFVEKEFIPDAKMNMEKRRRGINYSCDLKLIRKDGSPLWVILNSKSFFDDSGKFTGSLSMITDITERKEAEEKLKETLDNLENLVKERTAELETAFNSLQESEKGLAEAQRMAHIGNWEWDIAADKAYWSDEMYRIFGRDPQKLAPPYDEYFNYTHPDDRDCHDNAVRRAINGEPYSIVHRIVLANGEVRTIHVQSEVIFNEKNIPIRIKGIVQDITERTKSEEKIRSLANIVESSNDAIITKSLEGIITSWNKGAEQIYGYSQEEVLGKPISILIPSHSGKESVKLTEMIKQGKRIHHYETSRLRKDGKLIDVSLNLSPVFDASGKLTAISVIARDITERKRVEEKLRESEEKYRNIVETANEGIALVSSEGIITYANKKMADMLGYTVEEGIGRPIFNFLSEKSIDIVKSNMEKRLKGIDSSYESQLIKKDGSLIWVHINAKSLFDKSGEFIGTLTMLADITESKRAEVALKENESRFRNLFEIIASGVAIIDVINQGHDFIFKDINPAYERIFHAKQENIIGKSLYEVFPNADKLGLDAVFRWVWLAGQHEFIPLTLYEDRNIALWLTTNIFRLPSGELVVVFEDITERKKADEALKESEEKYRNIVETANEGISIIDAEAKITYLNKRMEDLLGYNQEESINKSIWDFISEEFKTIAKLNLEKRRQGVNESIEIKLIRKDGSPIWVNINTKSIFDKTGAFIGSMNMLTDTTKRKEAEESLANIENARKKEIHHRIKNNLQVISSLLDLQAEKFKDREDIKDSEVLEAFRESQDRVISMALIHEELYRGGGFETLNFSPYIQELAGNLFLTYRLGSTDITLSMDLEEDLFFDMDTAIPLGIIVNELISNSFKHAFPNRDKGEIRIKFRRKEKRDFINIREESKLEGLKSTNLILSISDNGIGIPENLDIEHLDSLGLHLVTSLVEQLDGELEIKRNNGTEFTIRFTVIEKNNKVSVPVPINCSESPKFLH